MNDEDMRQWNNDAIAQITKGDNTPIKEESVGRE